MTDDVKPQDHWTVVGAIKAARALIKAGDDLSFAAQITGGTAGRDEALCLAVIHWSAERDKQKQVLRIIELEGDDPEVGVGYELCPTPKPQADHSEDNLQMVTPRDREAYLALNMLPPKDAADVRAGKWDRTTGMQVLARHRANHAQAEPVALAHISLEDDGPCIDLQVLNGETLQPSDTPVRLYTHPPAQDVAALVSLLEECVDQLWHLAKDPENNLLIKHARAATPALALCAAALRARQETTNG